MAALKVGFPLYDTFDSLDVAGPFQTFTFAGMDRYLIGPTCESVESFEGFVLKPRATFADCPQLDVLFVPGGADPVSVLQKGRPGDNQFLDFLAAQAPGCALVCSVCTGALLLAGAGLLDGHIVTTHWAFKPVLSLFKCKVVDDFRRYVRSGNRITGAGISSGLDESLYIVSLLYGTDRARQCQLAMQYHPQPIFHCGDPGDTDIRDNPAMVEDRITAFEVPQALNEIRKWLMG
ncbi:MAG TPA: DJ-1/PfpI family protein [Terracidiphilus sp.]|nr:DJ-1/PfpI family protein [Terracidiphilus sp.]